jgi:hypothetical protein
VRHALVVTYFFPPGYSIGGKRVHGFARHLPEHGWRTTVLTCAPHPEERVDPSFRDEELQGCDIRREYLSPRELKSRHRPPQGLVAKPAPRWVRVRDRRGLQRIRAELRLAPVIGPDAHLIPFLAARAARLAREVRAELIFVTGPPWEAAFAAAAAARLTGLPLVIDLRDPWSFNPIADLLPAWTRAAIRWLEPRLLGAAAAIVTTTEAVRDEYQRRLPGARVACVRSGFDDVPVAPRRSDAITLLHFGNCYGDRSLAPFLRALALVARRRGLGPGSLRLLNLGRVAQADLDLAERLGVAARFEHRAVLPYAEGLELLAGADLALLPSFGAEPWFIPGKLYDYLRVRAPILAESAPPEVARLLAGTRLGWTHPAEDTELLAGRIEDAVDARARGVPLVEPDPAALAALTTRATSAALARVFDEVAARRR